MPRSTSFSHSKSLLKADDAKSRTGALPRQERACATLGHHAELCREHPLLQGLAVVAAGSSGGGEAWRLPPTVLGESLFVYCVKGSGWCELERRLHPVRQGDLLILPPGTRCGCGPQSSAPWCVIWVRATGKLLSDYVAELSLGDGAPLLRTGEEPQVLRLLSEVLQLFRGGSGLGKRLRVSHALAYLLAVLIDKSRERSPVDANTTHKVAQAIIFMSDNLDKPVRVSGLARGAGMSPSYFSGLFKEQTGCAPHEYLHLLRMHRACQLLRGDLSIKEIAGRLGYQDQFHFSRQFKAFQGVSPSDYRQPPAG